MTNLINDFLSQPLWLSIPLVMIYLALLAYFLYILWHYRRNTLSAVVLTAALLVGQKATADSDITNGGQHYTLFDSEGYYTATAGSSTPTAYTYDYLVDNVIVPDLYGQPLMYMRSSRVRYSAAVQQIRTHGLTPVPISPVSRTISISWRKQKV